MTSGRSGYGDTVTWIRAARPPRRGWRTAQRAFAATFTAALPLMALIGLLSPGRFGSPRANTFRTGWPLYVLLALLAAPLLYGLVHGARIRWFIARMREPFRRAFSGDPRFEGAADALASCNGALKTRFALAWVWGPAAVAVVAGMLCFAVAYFAVDAVLARGNVGWETPILAAANALGSMLLFRVVAQRLLTWRLAVSVHRAVTVGYD